MLNRFLASAGVRWTKRAGILDFGAVQLQVGQKLHVRIHDIAFGGDGVGRANDFVVFVPFVVSGELVEVELTEVKKNFARAKLVQVLAPSFDRVEPVCPHFGRCGGCQYQHIRYETQLQVKHRQVVELLKRVGGFADLIVEPVVPCPKPYGYRNRIMVRSQWNKPEQKLNIGFVRWDCGLVEDVEECKIAEPAINEQLKQVRANPPPRGGLKVVLRIAPEGWEVPTDSFFQNNFHMLPRLVEVLRRKLESARTRFLVDVYSGVGFFAIELAGAVERFVGIEIDQRAVKAARKNASYRRVSNGSFVCGAAETLLKSYLEEFTPDATTVIIDPPRTGCMPETIKTLRQARPAQVIYVSCNPATMARDLGVLTADGLFELVRVTPLDMFPQTQHIECVAGLWLQAVKFGGSLT